MSILDDVLQEEYNRSKRMKSAMESELAALPEGYISRKNINGNQYYYLQRRYQSKIVSEYIPFDQVAILEERISRRKQLQASIKEINENIKKIRKAIE